MLLYTVLKALHLLSVIVWLGGMFFALFCLHPAVLLLPVPERVRVMVAALGRFFQAVAVAVALSLASGAWMFGRVAHTTKQAGAPFNPPLEWLMMAGLGLLMALIFGHIRFALFKRVRRAADAQDWSAAAAALHTIRPWVAINLTIGVVIVAVVLSGTMS